jgi:glycosyltransferase involved in cell wall biosynthesis
MTFDEFLRIYQKKVVLEHKNKVVTSVPNPVVSVWVVTYNQCKYIRQTLDGVLNQSTNFPFEIILGDDDSNDGTREICIEYARKYPNLIRLFFHSRANAIKIVGDRPNPNFQGIYNWYQCRGKYIATIEGDDYWIDPEKLQKQVDFMENHPDFAGVGSNFSVCDENNNVLKHAKYKNFTGTDFRLSYLNKFHAITRTLNVMYRNYPSVFDEITDLAHAPFLDRIIGVMMAKRGPIRILPDITAMFRDGSGFFTPLRSKIGKIQLEAQWEALAEYFSNTEWENFSLASLHIIKADLYHRMSFHEKLSFYFRNQLRFKPDVLFNKTWFRICSSIQPEELPQSLMLPTSDNPTP